MLGWSYLFLEFLWQEHAWLCNLHNFLFQGDSCCTRNSPVIGEIVTPLATEKDSRTERLRLRKRDITETGTGILEFGGTNLPGEAPTWILIFKEGWRPRCPLALLLLSSDLTGFQLTRLCLHCFSLWVSLWRLGRNSQSSHRNVQHAQCLINFPLPYMQNMTQRHTLPFPGKGLNVL